MNTSQQFYFQNFSMLLILGCLLINCSPAVIKITTEDTLVMPEDDSVVSKFQRNKIQSHSSGPKTCLLGTAVLKDGGGNHIGVFEDVRFSLTPQSWQITYNYRNHFRKAFGFKVNFQLRGHNGAVLKQYEHPLEIRCRHIPNVNHSLSINRYYYENSSGCSMGWNSVTFRGC